MRIELSLGAYTEAIEAAILKVQRHANGGMANAKMLASQVREDLDRAMRAAEAAGTTIEKARARSVWWTPDLAPSARTTTLVWLDAEKGTLIVDRGQFPASQINGAIFLALPSQAKAAPNTHIECLGCGSELERGRKICPHCELRPGAWSDEEGE